MIVASPMRLDALVVSIRHQKPTLQSQRCWVLVSGRAAAAATGWTNVPADVKAGSQTLKLPPLGLVISEPCLKGAAHN